MTGSDIPNTSLTAEAHEARVLAWRRARVGRLTAPESWLSLVGKFWLHEGANTVGSDPDCDVVLPAQRAPSLVGWVLLHEGALRFSPAPSVTLSVRRANASADQPVHEEITLATDARGEPDRIILGSLRMEVMQRADSVAIRVRDSESDARLHFPGIDYFPIGFDWRIEARFVPYQPHRRIELAYETGSFERYAAPGYVAFERDGVEHRLDPVLDGDGTRLFVLFSDLTNRSETYPSGRFLYAPLPERDHVLLDFNQAWNPPCAFTAYAFCPLPPPQNRLALRVEAGEKRPRPALPAP